MKKIVKMMVCVIMLSIGHTLNAQNLVTEVQAKVIPMDLEVTDRKTTNLIFPYGIKSVDRGSDEVLVQKAKGVENILQVKAASDSLRETNLTVVCSDGTLYSFVIRYTVNPGQLNFSLGKVVAQTPWALFASADNNEAKINDLATQLVHKKREIKNIKDFRNNISLRCTGIYIKDDIMYFQIELENISTINYTVDQLRFYTEDLKKAKRTASQQVQVSPLYIAGNSSVISTNSRQTIVAAFPKFTIPNQKVLVIEMMEKEGGRNLKIHVRNRHMVNVTQL